MSAPAGRPLRDRRALQVVEERVVDPLAVERDHRVGDRARCRPSTSTSSRAVGVQQHQVGAGVHEHRVGDLGPVGADVVALARRADVDDVVVELHRLVGRDGLRRDVDRAGDVGAAGCGDGEGEQRDERHEERRGGHAGRPLDESGSGQT